MAAQRHRAGPVELGHPVRPGGHGQDLARARHRRDDEGYVRGGVGHRRHGFGSAPRNRCRDKRLSAFGLRTILFVDEIHRFNRSQQDALLHAVEDRVLVLVGATTENPFFEVNSALISRSRVVELHGLSDERSSASWSVRWPTSAAWAAAIGWMPKRATPSCCWRAATARGAHHVGACRWYGAARHLEEAREDHRGQRARGHAASLAALRQEQGHALRRHLGVHQVHARQPTPMPRCTGSPA